MLRLRMPTKPLRIHYSINFAHQKCGTVGLFVSFPYKIQHNLVELFGAKTSLTVVYVLAKMYLNRQKVELFP